MTFNQDSKILSWEKPQLISAVSIVYKVVVVTASGNTSRETSNTSLDLSEMVTNGSSFTITIRAVTTAGDGEEVNKTFEVTCKLMTEEDRE